MCDKWFVISRFFDLLKIIGFGKINYMKKEKMTMEKLAVMVKNEFDNVNGKMTTGFEAVNKRFDGIDQRLDKIENLLIRAHENRIEKLEDVMRVVKTKLGIH